MPYDGIFPVHSPVPQQSDKFHQIFRELMDNLKNILDGYNVPEPYFSQDLRDKVEKLFTILKNPCLPLLELQVGKNFC